MFRYCLIFFLLVLCFIPLKAESVLPENIELSAQLDLFAAQASTPKYFLQDYKEAAAKLTLDFNYNFTYDFRFNFLPYVQAAYDINNSDRTQAKARIWQIYFEYLLNDFNFTLGRFTFEDETLAPFVYYGADLVKDLALPTALDGIKHSYSSPYFAYTILAGKETEIDAYTKAKVAGIKAETTPLSWLSICAFYFYQNKKYSINTKNIKHDLSFYGAGINLFFTDTSGLKFAFAKNFGTRETERFGVITDTDYKGYAFTGELYFEKLYKAGALNTKLGFYSFSSSDPFVPFANKLNVGIIYGGMNYNNIFVSSPEIIYADFNFAPHKYPALFIGGGVFMYASQKNALNNRTYYASEVDLRIGADFDTWGVKLSGGLFNGEALFFGNPSAESQQIKKIQVNFFYKLDF